MTHTHTHRVVIKTQKVKIDNSNLQLTTLNYLHNQTHFTAGDAQLL